MADIPLRDRPFDAFLSHAHADKAVVDVLYRWLERAGLKVWYDAIHLGAGAKIATELGQAIARCRSVLVVMSQASVDSGWVEDEWNLASVERNNKATRDFRIIPIRIEDCQVPRILVATKWVDFVDRMDDITAWSDLLDAITSGGTDLDAVSPLDLYISRSWKSGREQPLGDQVLARLQAPNVRLIGDSPDWATFSPDRIRSIMRSCSGVVCIIPNRPRTIDDDKLKYFIREARTAARLGLPLLVIAETGADLPKDIPVQLFANGQGIVGQPDLESELIATLEDFS